MSVNTETREKALVIIADTPRVKPPTSRTADEVANASEKANVR